MFDTVQISAGGWLSPDPEPHIDAAPGFVDHLNPRGYFTATCYDKFGNKKWEMEFPNGITNEGLNTLLNVMFVADTQLTTWYIGLISATSYSALAAADTMASHGGWTESVAYSNSTRPQWTAGTSTSKSTTNASTVDFAMNSDGTVLKGIFITSGSAKSGTAGKLWSTGLFGSDATLNNGDTLKINYTVNVS